MNTLKILMLSLFLATSVGAIEKLNNETLAQRIKNKDYQNIKNWDVNTILTETSKKSTIAVGISLTPSTITPLTAMPASSIASTVS
jgi:hypothetical protein